MKKLDRKWRVLVLAILLALLSLANLWASMMHWHQSAFAQESETVAFYVIMILWIDYRKAVGFALCLVDLIEVAFRGYVGGQGQLWLIPDLLLVLYFVWCLVAIALKARKARQMAEIPGSSLTELGEKSNN
jgi:hypothetical protein